MASFNVVNYSLRPSKSIQRQIVFGGIRSLKDQLQIKDLVYVGLGSIWFVDFILAHKALEIDRLVSIEADEFGFRRAKFNAPFSTVDVRRGSSSDVLPELCADPEYCDRPWVVWLDYDGLFDEALREDARLVVEQAPENTIFLLTFNSKAQNYGAAKERPDRLRDLFGELVPADLLKSDCVRGSMEPLLANLAMDFLKSAARNVSRPGGFLSGFRILYRDGAPMVTIGGMLPSPGLEQDGSAIINDGQWRCLPQEPIIAPHLTMKEFLALQSKLPDPNGLSRITVQTLGFDLEEDQIRVYERYYREYPAFAQIVT